MPRAAELFSVAADPRLTSDSVRIVLHFAQRGPGPHEYNLDELRELLNEAGEKVVRRALQRAERHGYLIRKRGGRQHTDTFSVNLTPAKTAGLNSGAEPNTPAALDRLCDHLDKPNRPPYRLTPAKTAGLIEPHTRETSPLQHARELDSTEPPVVPLSERADAAIAKHEPVLRGCRDALRDYLAARVRAERQSAYVYALACWFDDPHSHFCTPEGGVLHERLRPKVVALALNELLQHGEQQTALKGMRPMARPDGDIRNLHTKIEILIKQRWEREHRQRGNRDDGGGTGSAQRGEAPRKSDLSHLS